MGQTQGFRSLDVIERYKDSTSQGFFWAKSDLSTKKEGGHYLGVAVGQCQAVAAEQCSPQLEDHWGVS